MLSSHWVCEPVSFQSQSSTPFPKQSNEMTWLSVMHSGMDQPRFRPASSGPLGAGVSKSKPETGACSPLLCPHWEFQEAQAEGEIQEDCPQLHALYARFQNPQFHLGIPNLSISFTARNIGIKTATGRGNREILGYGMENGGLVDYETGVNTSAKKIEKK